MLDRTPLPRVARAALEEVEVDAVAVAPAMAATPQEQVAEPQRILFTQLGQLLALVIAAQKLGEQAAARARDEDAHRVCKSCLLVVRSIKPALDRPSAFCSCS